MTEIESTFALPDLGEGLTEAEIVSWHVSPGDHVVTDQPLVTVETDKAVVDIPSPRSGTIGECLGSPGDIVQVGEPLVRFGEKDSGRDAGAVVGELPEQRSATEEPTAQPENDPVSGVRASPKARQRARELGVNLERVVPTGPEGVIQLRDVQAAAPTDEPAKLELPAKAPGALTGVRRAMARRMADAHARVARATVTGEADIGAWPRHGSPMLRLVRAIGRACEAEPRLNAGFDDRSASLQLNTEVNLGIAMETDDGLFVPVLGNVAASTEEAIATELEAIEQAVVSRTVRPADLKGQTITLSNFGAIGGLHAEMVVVPPQVAIVGAGRSFERLVMLDGKPAETRILPLSISFDHRVITGVEACRFLNTLVADLEIAD